jgi:hypothetical protein
MQKQNCLRVDNFAFVDIARSSSSVGSRIFNIFAFAFVFEPAALAAKKASFSAELPGFI